MDKRAVDTARVRVAPRTIIPISGLLKGCQSTNFIDAFFKTYVFK